MDEIIYLEPDEEITSVIDKIKNASSMRLGLVVPRQASLLQSVVNLRLLSREATVLGKEIVIVTTDKIGRNLAVQVGLQVYNSVEEQKPIYQPPPPTPTSDEVIELDMAQATNEEETETVPGVKVQHYQTNQKDPGKIVSHKLPEKSVIRPQSIEAIPKDNYDPSSVKHILNKKERDLRRLRKIIWPIIGIFVVLSLIATYLLLPKANIKIFVPSEDLKKSLQISVSNKVNSPNLEQNVLPGRLVESLAEKEGKFPATGKKNIGEKASGTIMLYNNLDSNSHTIEAETKLSSSSKTFFIKDSVTIPGAGVQSGKVVPGSVSVDIVAENPGEEYNVVAGRFSILEIPASEQEALYGQSAKDLSGGMSKEVQVVSVQDYDNAKNGLLKDLQETVKKDRDKKVANDTLLEKSLVVSDPEVSVSSNVDQEATEFQMKIKYKEQSLVFSDDDLSSFVISILQKQIPSDKMITIAESNNIGLNVDKTAYDKGQMDLTANVLAKVSEKVDTDKIKAAILGKGITETQNYVQNQDGVKSAEISIRPSWWLKKVPNLERNVNLEIEYVNLESSNENIKP